MQTLPCYRCISVHRVCARFGQQTEKKPKASRTSVPRPLTGSRQTRVARRYSDTNTKRNPAAAPSSPRQLPRLAATTRLPTPPGAPGRGGGPRHGQQRRSARGRRRERPRLPPGTARQPPPRRGARLPPPPPCAPAALPPSLPPGLHPSRPAPARAAPRRPTCCRGPASRRAARPGSPRAAEPHAEGGGGQRSERGRRRQPAPRAAHRTARNRALGLPAPPSPHTRYLRGPGPAVTQERGGGAARLAVKRPELPPLALI